jgi:dihydrofolate reductase
MSCDSFEGLRGNRKTSKETITMGKILVHEFIAIDGVYEDPSWTVEFPFDPRMGEAIGAVMGSSEGLLLGRRTYEMFAPAWSARTAEEDPGAPFMNDSPKYVVSGTLESGDWNNTILLGAYNPTAIADLKESLAGDLYVSGSGRLVRSMLADGLVDELHLFVYPVARGSGERLFAEGEGPTTFELAASEAFGSGVVHLAYRPRG